MRLKQLCCEPEAMNACCRVFLAEDVISCLDMILLMAHLVSTCLDKNVKTVVVVEQDRVQRLSLSHRNCGDDSD